MHQRARAIEIFRVRQQVNDLRDGTGPLRSRQQTVDRAGFRIGFRTIGKRKEIDRVQNVEELQRVARRLAESMVERAAAGAADLIEDAVEHAAALLVFVEALIEEMAQETAALRNAPAHRGVRAADRIRARRVVFHEADEISSSREAASKHPRAGRSIHHVVDTSGLEATVERDGSAIDETPA